MLTRFVGKNGFNDRTCNTADEVTSIFGIETNEMFEQHPSEWDSRGSVRPFANARTV